MRAISRERSGLGAVRAIRWRARSWAIVTAGSRSRSAFRRMTARATARAPRSLGQPRPASSQAYSQIASESHTSSAPCSQHRHAPRGARGARSSRANSGVSSGITRSANSSPRCFIEQPWAQRPRRVVLVAHGEQHFVQDVPPLTCTPCTLGAGTRDLFRPRQHALGSRAGADARGAHSRRLARAADTRRSRERFSHADVAARCAPRCSRSSRTRHTIFHFCGAKPSRGCAARRWATSGTCCARSVRALARRAQSGRAVRRGDSGARDTRGAAIGWRRSPTATRTSR